MPEVNLLKDTQSPEDESKKPIRPKPDFEVSDPTADKGMGHFFKTMLGRSPKTEVPETSKMGLPKAKGDQRILKETRKIGPALAALPEDDDKNLDVNLLTEDIINREKPREQMMRLIMVAVGAIVVVALAYGGLLYAQRSVTTQITESNDQLAAVQAEIDSLTSKKNTIEETVQKIGAIRGLVDRHVRWSHFFGLLEKYTLPSVTYGRDFAGDISGALVMSAKTTSYQELAKQYLVYQQAIQKKELLSGFSITGAAKSKDASGNDEVTFSITMNVLPSAFENSEVSKADQLSVLPELKEATKTFTTYVAGLCYLRAQPADITVIPRDAQPAFETAIGFLQNSDCDPITTAQLTEARNKFNIDSDQDGLNSLLEEVFGTDDQKVDTDNNGQTDLDEFMSQITTPTGV